ncbi:N-acetylmuramoyl-L-alanine amidase [Pseudoxanthomonas sp. CF385]|uniref:N-acetylmuramoyl-L-alanine amidase n=2 Tax=Gammaproteobacteria TaxID=1236 RepID=UPI00087E5C2E|nr:N-acetylmuramoyl-L-alanine amidase [Pseudoxanthomonas sp. CF385]SDQ86712.1 N-acetylmuramoyl-L-alanine amidase [Pseudoxanthomonas sp. CF385]
MPTTVTLRAALAGLLAVLPLSLWAGEVTGVSIAQGATGTRAEIQLAGAGQYKTLSLKGPDRLVVDLPASKARAGLRLPAPAGIVRAVRTGQPDPNTLRIVFDLASPVAALNPRMEQAGESSRLVIEWPGDGAAPAASTQAVASAPSTTAPPPTPTSASQAQADAARATALLTAQVAQAGQAPAATPPSTTVSASPSPQAILNGQSTATVVPADAGSPPPTYTIATGQPTPMPGSAAANVASDTAAATPKASPVVTAGMRPLVIAIDPGHGGQDPGAIGPSGRYEKHAVLAISKELARQINATPGMKAYLVRDTDVYVERPQRARKARAAKADMFVSIHADAAENRSAWGSSVYVLSLRGASSQHARWLADKENASDLVGGVRLTKDTLSNVLLDLAQSGHMKASQDAAGHVLTSLKDLGKTHKPQIEFANFEVLRNSDMPAMLVETGFISNADEEKRLFDPAHQRKVAGAVLDGIQSYFTRQPPPGTLFAARAQAEAEARSVAAGGAAGAP